MKLMKVRANDANVLYEKLKIFIPNLDEIFNNTLNGIFSIYELEGFHYTLSVEDETIDVANDEQALKLFKYIASNCYLHITPFVGEDGKLIDVTKRKEKTTTSGTSSADNTGLSNRKNISENSPLNADIDSINTPTYKSKDVSDFENNNSSEFDTNATKEYISPEYIREYEKINTKFTEIISADLDRFIFEIRQIY